MSSVKLRDHPFMTHHSAHNWPPTWVHVSGSRQKNVVGEIGTLRNAAMSHVVPQTTCYLSMEFEGECYMGALLFDDAAFCWEIFVLLRQQIGRPIKEIGDFDVSFSL